MAFNLETIVFEYQAAGFNKFLRVIFRFVHIEASIGFMKSEDKIKIPPI